MVKPRQLGQVAEDRRQAEEEDRRREHAGDRRARARAGSRSAPRRISAQTVAQARRATAHQPALSRVRSATRAERDADRRRRCAIAAERLRAIVPATARDDRVADPLDDEAERVVVGDRLPPARAAGRAGRRRDERKRITKTSGKRPWTTRRCPCRSAIAAPMPAEGDRRRARRAAIISSSPGDAAARCGRRRSARSRGTRAPRRAPSAAVPASRPSTIAKREIGAAKRRSVKPISMSTASAIPPLLPASSVDWIIAPASMKSRKLCDLREAGQVDRAAGAAGLDRRAAASGRR